MRLQPNVGDPGDEEDAMKAAATMECQLSREVQAFDEGYSSPLGKCFDIISKVDVSYQKM